MAESPDDEPIEIEIDPEMVVFIITKAREYDEEVAPDEDEEEPQADVVIHDEVSNWYGKDFTRAW